MATNESVSETKGNTPEKSGDLSMTRTIQLPEGVTASYTDGLLVIKGPQGEAQRVVRHPRFTVIIENQSIILKTTAKKPSKRDKMFLGSFASHIKNMIRGVQEPFVYTLKICSGHFPMNVAVQNNQLIVKNFIGEKVPRVLDLKEGVDVKVSGDIITVTSPNKELAGMVASDIEQLTRRPGFDSRVFQDGIYIVQKDDKKIA